MTATGVGFVQRHEQDAKEGALYQSIETHLTQRYGKVRSNVAPGLRWLWGHDGHNHALDHAEYRIKDGFKTITSRPYGLGLDDIEWMASIAKEKNLYLRIETPSNYNLDTLLVIFTQRPPNYQSEEERATR